MRRVAFHRPGALDEALALKAEHGSAARWAAGATDLLVALREESGREPAIHVIDLGGIAELRGIGWAGESGEAGGSCLRIGARATHAEIAVDPLVRAYAAPLAESSAEVGSPLIRNRATIGGNIVNAASCADTVPPLVALEAVAVLRSRSGERSVPVAELIRAPYETVLAPDELLVEVRFAPLAPGARGVFRKLGRRGALSISRLSVAVILDFAPDGTIASARVAGGSLTPTVRRFPEAEALLAGAAVTDELFAAAGAALAEGMIRITGRRWSTPYKEPVAAAWARRALAEAAAGRGSEAGGDAGSPEAAGSTRPCGCDASAMTAPGPHDAGASGAEPHPVAVSFRLNGRPCAVSAPAHWTLLRLLREGLHLTGTKCGCEVGQCGACTVLLDGRAVAACLVLAGQVDGASVETVEGLASDVRPDGTGLHPLQRAFLDHDAVACGFCTPGMLLSAHALLAENPHPSRDEIRRAISGNLCRCTGYAPIVEAIEAAAAELNPGTGETDA